MSEIAERLEWTLWRTFPSMWVSIVLGTIGLVLSFIFTSPAWVMPLWTIVAYGIGLGWGIVEYCRGGRAYALYNVLHVWGPDAVEKGYYIPKEEMRVKLHDPWYKRWEGKVPYARNNLIGGCEIHFVGDEPHTGWYRGEGDNPIPDVDPDQPGVQVYGMTWARHRKSRIYAGKALDMDTTGHEMDLLAFWKAFPAHRNWSEKRKVQFLMDKGIKS